MEPWEYAKQVNSGAVQPDQIGETDTPTLDSSKLENTQGGMEPWEVAKAYNTANKKIDEHKERSLGDEAVRQLGLTGRAVVKGVTAIPNTLINASTALGNLDNMAAQKVFGAKEAQVPYVNGDQQADTLGLPRPETGTERVIGDVGEAGVGVMTGNAAASGAAKGGSMLAKFFTEKLGVQAASATTGALASGTVREEGGGPLAQTAAAVLGAAAPSAATAIPAIAAAGARGVGRAGTSAAEMQSNIAQFEQAKVEPTLGAVTGRPQQAIESTLAKTPGSGGVMNNAGERVSGQVAGRVENLADTLAAKSSATEVGKAVEAGISGKGGWISKIKSKQEQMYNDFDKYVPDQTPVEPVNTMKALGDVTGNYEGATETSKALVNPKLKSIFDAFTKDTQAASKYNAESFITGKKTPAALPYAALKDIRTQIGSMLSEFSLTSDIPRSELKRVYAALSQDMEGAAKMAGPDAEVALARANGYTKAFHDRVDQLEGLLSQEGGPEAIMNAAMQGTKDGATRLTALMHNLPDQSRKMFSSAFLRKMGVASAGKQNAQGDVFSIDQFVTVWNKVSPEAKEALFGKYGQGYKEDIDNIVSVASKLKDGSKVLSNPSGSAAAATHIGGGAAIAGALMYGNGNVPVALGLVKIMAGANVLGKAMANPKLVKWLAKTTKLPASAKPQALAELVAIANANDDDPEIKEVAAALGATNDPAASFIKGKQ